MQTSQDEENPQRSDGGPEQENTSSLRDPASSVQSSSQAGPSSASRFTTAKTRGRKRQLDDLRSAVHELRTVHKNLNQPECQVSESEAFGQYVTACLNKLPVQESVLLQADIQSLITKYRLKAVQTMEVNRGPTSSPILDEEHSFIPPAEREEEHLFNESIYSTQSEDEPAFHELVPCKSTSNDEDSGQEGTFSNILSKAWQLSK